MFPHAGTQFAQQFGRLGKTLAKNVARALERCLRVGNTVFGGGLVIDIFRRFLLRVERRIGEQRIRQRLQPGLARIMPEVGDRTWKLYYAAQAENWPLAAFQAKEIRGLMDLRMSLERWRGLEPGNYGVN